MTGPQGATGATGPQGATGATGPSVQSINSTAVSAAGFTALVSPSTTLTTTPTAIFSWDAALGSEWPYVDAAFGLLGFITMSVASATTLAWTATISRNNSTDQAIIGTFYYTDTARFTVPVNLISQIGTNPDVLFTFSEGDQLLIKFYAATLSSTVQVASAPQLLQAIYAPITNTGEAYPPSGTLDITSPIAYLSALSPANSYYFTNSLGSTATLTLYRNGAQIATATVAAGATYPEAPIPGVTSINAFMMTASVLPPSGTITVSQPVSQISPLDAANTYRFTNATGAAADLTMYLTTAPQPGFPLSVASGDTYPALQDPALTGYDGYTLAPPDPPVPPSGTIVMTTVTPGQDVLALDPNNSYRFQNGATSDVVLSLYINGVLDNQYGVFQGDYYPAGGSATVTGLTGFRVDAL